MGPKNNQVLLCIGFVGFLQKWEWTLFKLVIWYIDDI